jgi:hypothetical protein
LHIPARSIRTVTFRSFLSSFEGMRSPFYARNSATGLQSRVLSGTRAYWNNYETSAPPLLRARISGVIVRATCADFW